MFLCVIEKERRNFSTRKFLICFHNENERELLFKRKDRETLAYIQTSRRIKRFRTTTTRTHSEWKRERNMPEWELQLDWIHSLMKHPTCEWMDCWTIDVFHLKELLALFNQSFSIYFNLNDFPNIRIQWWKIRYMPDKFNEQMRELIKCPLWIASIFRMLVYYSTKLCTLRNYILTHACKEWDGVRESFGLGIHVYWSALFNRIA